MMRANDIGNFEKKIEKVTESGCWIWMGRCIYSGYGHFDFNNKAVLAHRWGYEHYTKTKIPPKMTIDHLCRVRCCVNPAHLEVVTQSENLRRSRIIYDYNRNKTHCLKGHPLSGDNLYMHRYRNSTHRHCRECKRAEIRQRRARNKKGVRKMNESIESICTWADETFGPAPLYAQVRRIMDEVKELRAAITDQAILEEAADVYITLCRLEGLQEAVDRKMGINRKRTWISNGDGTGYHLKEERESNP